MLHYGNELAVNNITYYDFNKIELKANKFNPLECPPWTKKDGKFTSGLLPFPPSPLSFESKVSPGLRAACIVHTWELLCRHCSVGTLTMLLAWCTTALAKICAVPLTVPDVGCV